MITKQIKTKNKNHNLSDFKTLENPLEIFDSKINSKKSFNQFIRKRVMKNQQYDKGGIHIFCAEFLCFVEKNVEDEPLLVMYKNEESLYSNYLKYCEQNQIKPAGKIKFGREINQFLREKYKLKDPDDVKTVKNNTLYLKNFVFKPHKKNS